MMKLSCIFDDLLPPNPKVFNFSQHHNLAAQSPNQSLASCSQSVISLSRFSLLCLPYLNHLSRPPSLSLPFNLASIEQARHSIVFDYRHTLRWRISTWLAFPPLLLTRQPLHRPLRREGEGHDDFSPRLRAPRFPCLTSFLLL